MEQILVYVLLVYLVFYYTIKSLLFKRQSNKVEDIKVDYDYDIDLKSVYDRISEGKNITKRELPSNVIDLSEYKSKKSIS